MSLGLMLDAPEHHRQRHALIGPLLDERKAGFASEILALNRTIKDRIMKLMESLQFDSEQLFLIRSIEMEINLSLDTDLHTNDIELTAIVTVTDDGKSSGRHATRAPLRAARGKVLHLCQKSKRVRFGECSVTDG